MIKSFSNKCNCDKCQDNKSVETLSKDINVSDNFIQLSKTIVVLDNQGNPLKDAHVWNIDKDFGTVTNENGLATISGSQKDQIAVTHVSFDTEQFNFFDLPQSLQMQTQNLDEVTILADEPKQAGVGFGLALLGLGALFMFKKNKKKGLKSPNNDIVEITL